MEQISFKVYGYRWVVLLAFMCVVVVNQLLWITFAPITSSAAKYYGVSDLSIGLLSMSFMIVWALIIVSATCSAICQIAPWQVANLPYTRPKR